jgi:acetoin utilization protein AcuB
MFKHVQTVQSWMTPVPFVLGPKATLNEAHAVMRARGVRHLPVVDGAKLVGLVSERDLHLVESLRGVDLGRVRVEDAMTMDPYTVRPNSKLADAVSILAERKIGSAVVIEDGKVVGILTAVDALRAFAKLLGTGIAA